MGMLIEGQWTDEDRQIVGGAWVRPPGAFEQEIPAAVTGALRATPGRFHLIASASCPWSHRTMIVRRLKGLDRAIPLQIAGGERLQGYPVNGGDPWLVPGTDRRIRHLHQLYALGDPACTGRATVPVLWDSRTRRIVSNDSARIMRAFDDAPPAPGGPDFTLVPEALRDRIDRLNGRIHRDLSNAVYRAGFAQQQGAYDEAVSSLFATLDALDGRLADRRYLFGGTITETDWRLFPTLVGFDAVYHGLFRCSRRRLVDYPHLWSYARDLHGWRGIAGTIDMDAIRQGAWQNDGDNNPHRIVAVAPDVDWQAPHGRQALGPARLALRGGGSVEIAPGDSFLSLNRRAVASAPLAASH